MRRSDEKLRVFISYSHKNLALFELLKRELVENRNCIVLSDHDIEGGTPFTDSIKGRISHSHLFMPLITSEAQARPWVNQETGYAMALNIPIYPIVVGQALPKEMTAQLQWITVRRKPGEFIQDLRSRLGEHPPVRLVDKDPLGPVDMVRVADWAEQRAEWLGDYAQRVLDLGYTGMVRQTGIFSSFCIPDLPTNHEAWDSRDELHERGSYLRHLLRRERQLMEQHARSSGCRLILHPSINLHHQTPGAHATRMKIVRDAILSISKDKNAAKLQVVISPRPPGGNLIIVGDWFLATSAAPRPEGYVQTLFNWHAPTARSRSKQFDQEFADLHRENGIKSTDGIPEALDELERLISSRGGLPGSA